MVEEVSFGRLTPGSPYILVRRGFEDVPPEGGIFESYAKSGRHWTAVFSHVEDLAEGANTLPWDSDDESSHDGIKFDPRRTRFFRDLSHVVRATMKKGTDQMVREVYETKTGQDSAPGSGPADLIRKFLKSHPPKHAMGGRTRRRRARKTRRRHK
jgi:hypothetical protein